SEYEIRLSRSRPAGKRATAARGRLGPAGRGRPTFPILRVVLGSGRNRSGSSPAREVQVRARGGGRATAFVGARGPGWRAWEVGQGVSCRMGPAPLHGVRPTGAPSAWVHDQGSRLDSLDGGRLTFADALRGMPRVAPRGREVVGG